FDARSCRLLSSAHEALLAEARRRVAVQDAAAVGVALAREALVIAADRARAAGRGLGVAHVAAGARARLLAAPARALVALDRHGLLPGGARAACAAATVRVRAALARSRARGASARAAARGQGERGEGQDRDRAGASVGHPCRHALLSAEDE